MDSPGRNPPLIKSKRPKVYLREHTTFAYMASSTRDNNREHEDEIRMWREDEMWVITDVETGVTTQGDSREEALEMLDEAVGLHKGEIGEEIDDEEAFIEEIGIDPDEVEPTEELPDFMK
jgi:predicted RNase H-like HicB family nuclease